MPAGIARAGAEVHHVVGAANGFFVVLDDEHGVAKVAQLFERGNQAVVVARVQADGWLVQHVEHAAQLRADLRGQANALRLAAGKRGGGAIQAEVAEADGQQKIQARGNFGERAAGDVALPRGQARANFVHGRARVGNRQRRELGDGAAAHFYGQTFRTQALLARTPRRARETCIA